MSKRILLLAMLICRDQSRAQIFLAGYVHDSVVNQLAIEHPAEAQQAHAALNMFNLGALLFYSPPAFPQSRVAIRDPKGTVYMAKRQYRLGPQLWSSRELAGEFETG